MSSYHHFTLLPMVITLVLAIVALLILPLDAQNDFQVKLRHVDSGANLTKLELLRRSLKRDEQRFQSLYPMALAASHHSIQSLVHAGMNAFLMDLSIGTPPKPYVAILDTGSDLIWTQCNPCKQCFDQPTPIFDPSKSSSFSKLPCSNHLCTALSTLPCNRDKSCEYLYTYGDNSSTRGFIATETLRFGKDLIPNVGFGCGLLNKGDWFNQADGVVGLGRGPLSLVSQLNVTMFSYCLPSFDSSGNGTLLMGSCACENTIDQSGSINNTTPLIQNDYYPFYYYLSLKGITVGDTKLPINKSTFAIESEGSGGMIIDSGTTLTYIEKSAFNLTKEEFIKQVKLPVVDESNEVGLDLCFKLTPNAQNITFPKLIFHFEGFDLVLPEENYIYVDSSGVACLAMGGSRGLSIFGNFQLQNIKVVHDLKRETLTFVHKMCDQL